MEHINNMWELISTNSFVGAFTSGIAILIVVFLFKSAVNKYRSHQVFKALKAGLADKGRTFLPSSFLSAQTNYTLAKIEQLCISHSKIVRNEKERESWQLKE
jgi:hypothetical protein